MANTSFNVRYKYKNIYIFPKISNINLSSGTLSEIILAFNRLEPETIRDQKIISKQILLKALVIRQLRLLLPEDFVCN